MIGENLDKRAEPFLSFFSIFRNMCPADLAKTFPKLLIRRNTNMTKQTKRSIFAVQLLLSSFHLCFIRPSGNYILKLTIETLEQGVKYVQS